jgi:hypothetical protein
MRRPHTRFRQVRPPRFGAALAFVTLLVQLLLPSASALAMGDPLGAAPICSTGTSHSGGQGGSHKAVHAACPLCQAPSVVWGFVPPVQTFVTGPQRLVQVVWHRESIAVAPGAVGSLRARGPPGGA